MHLHTFLVLLLMRTDSVESTWPIETSTGGPPNSPSIKIATTLSLDIHSTYVSYAKGLKQGYFVFAEWLHEERPEGGIVMNATTHRLELLFFGDGSDPGAVKKITRHIVQDLHIKLLLGPFGSALTIEAANVANETGAVVLAPASGSWLWVFDSWFFVFDY